MKIELLPNRVQVHVRCWIDPDAEAVRDSYRSVLLHIDKHGHCDVAHTDRDSVQEGLEILTDEGMLVQKQVSEDGDLEYFLTGKATYHFSQFMIGLKGWHEWPHE